MVVFTVLLISTIVQLSALAVGFKAAWHSRFNIANLTVTGTGALLFLRGMTLLLLYGTMGSNIALDVLGESIILVASLALLIGNIRLTTHFILASPNNTPYEDDKKHKQLLNATLESTADGIFVVDNQGNLLHSNMRFAEMWRIPKSLVNRGLKLYSLDYILDQLDDPLRFQEQVQELTRSSKADISTLKFMDGRKFECYTVPLSQGEREFGRVWSYRDITKLKRTEETAMLYLDLMSHDIRNRLQGIVMSIEILNMFVDDPDSVGTLRDIESNVQRCATLISKVKATEKIDDAPLYPRSLQIVIGETVHDIRSRFSDVTIEYEPVDFEAVVLADRFLETLLVNLLENAVLHNTRKDKRIWVSLTQLDRGYEVSIADNGPGIGDELKADLFDKDRRYGGVGLHLVSHISEKYGGNLQVSDRIAYDPSEGLDFRIWIPKVGYTQNDFGSDQTSTPTSIRE
jgi:signal transduction histidine kinase